MPSAARKPVENAAWILYPPVSPSISSTSPGKYRPGTIFDSKVFWFTCSRATPPRVTMATEKSPGAATMRGNSVTFAMSFDRCTVEKCEHLRSTRIPDRASSFRLRRSGIGYAARSVESRQLLFSSARRARSAANSSRPRLPANESLTSSPVRMSREASRIPGPDNPRWVNRTSPV